MQTMHILNSWCTCLLSILPNMDTKYVKYAMSTAYCLAYFTYVDRYVDIPYYFKYFKYAKG